MAEAASVEIHAAHKVAGNVFVVVQRVPIAESGAQEVLEIREAKERAHVLGDLVVQTAQSVAFMERIGKGARERRERSRYWHRHRGMLNGSLAINEEKQLVLDDRSTEIATVLATLEGRGESYRCRQRRRKRAIAECAEGIAVEGIASRFRGHVYSARRSQLRGHIQTRLANLKFLNGAGRDIGGGGTYGFVRDVDAVNLDACGASETSAKGDRRVAGLGGVKVLAVLNLNAGLELGEIKEVAAIHWQVRNLIFGDHTLHGRLLRVHRYGVGLDFDDLTRLAKLQSGVTVSGIADLHVHRDFSGLEPAGLDSDNIRAWDQGAGGISASGIRGHVGGRPFRLFGDSDLGSANDGTGRIRHYALDTAVTDSRLCEQNCGREEKSNRQSKHYKNCGVTDRAAEIHGHRPPSFQSRNLYLFTKQKSFGIREAESQSLPDHCVWR